MSGFDRIKPPDRRLPEHPDGGPLDDADPTGRAALFSSGAPPAGGGTFGLGMRCSRCRATSALDAGTALRAAFPLVLLAPWRRHPVFAVCPACRRRAWLRIVRDS